MVEATTMALSEGVNSAISSGLADVQANAMGVVTQALPYILGVLGLTIAVTLVVKWAKKIGK